MPSPRNDLSNDVTVTQQSLDDRGLAVKTSDDAAAAAAKKLETGGVSDAVDDDDDAKYLCGLGPFKPSCLQRLNNPIGALCFLCWYAFVQGFVTSGISNVNVTSWEVRFGFSSTLVSLITVVFDIAAGILVLPITYFGAHAHQMRMLAFSALIMAAGFFVMTIPHWITGVYEIGADVRETCEAPSFSESNSSSGTTCHSDINNGGYLAILMVGAALYSVGATALYSIGIIYIDTNALPGDSVFRQGILYATSTLGPAAGYLIGGYLISYYVDLGRVPTDSISLTPDDPRWVGAWWLGYLIGGSLAITVFISLLPYPKEFKSTAAIREERLRQREERVEVKPCQGQGEEGVKNSDVSTDVYVDRTVMPKVKDVPSKLAQLFRNGVFLNVSLASAMEIFLVSGTTVFLPQLIQLQFYQSSGTSAIIAGAVAVPSTVIGQVVGGYVCRRLSLGVRGMLKFCIIATVVSICIGPCLLARCPTTKLVGITEPYMTSSQGQGQGEGLEHACNSHCACTTLAYDPVCDVTTGLEYFSPCFAGCNLTSPEHAVFHNCTCLPVTSNRSVVTGRCGLEEESCNMMYVFLPTFLLLIFANFIITVPALNVTLRCVEDNQRSFALGVQWCLMRFLGYVPGPLVFGVVFDSACLVWQEGCGAVGTCWVTDNDALAYRFLAIFMVLQALVLLFSICAYVINEKLSHVTHPAAASDVVQLSVHHVTLNDSTDKCVPAVDDADTSVTTATDHTDTGTNGFIVTKQQ